MGSHHHHHSKERAPKKLRAAFFLNLGFTIIELIGGVYVNSVAVVSDAVHDLGDSLSLGFSWYLANKSNQKSTTRYTFGYARFTLLGAFVNSVVLILGAVFVVYKALGRLANPEMPNVEGMIGFAVLGVAVNGFAAWKLIGGKTLNEQVISWHLIEDVLGWVAVLVVAIVLQFYPNPYLDPILSLLVTAFILWGVFSRLRETIHLFLQGAPDNLSLDEVENKLLAVKEVVGLHHSHIWSLDGEDHVFTTHVKLCELNSLAELRFAKATIRDVMSAFHFAHYTIEFELEGEPCGLDDCDDS